MMIVLKLIYMFLVYISHKQDNWWIFMIVSLESFQRGSSAIVQNATLKELAAQGRGSAKSQIENACFLAHKSQSAIS